MNRLAIHESAAADLSPTQLVDVAARSGSTARPKAVRDLPRANRQRWRALLVLIGE